MFSLMYSYVPYVESTIYIFNNNVKLDSNALAIFRIIILYAYDIKDTLRTNLYFATKLSLTQHTLLTVWLINYYFAIGTQLI